jgi:hypothetical protein
VMALQALLAAAEFGAALQVGERLVRIHMGLGAGGWGLAVVPSP